MVQKRHFEEDGDDGLSFPLPEFKRIHIFGSDVNDLSLIEKILEPLIRRVVREELDHGLASRLYACPGPSSQLNQSETSGRSRRLQLKFTNKMPSTIFSNSTVEAENSSSICIALFDSISGVLVNSGPLSSIKIEIVPLKGEFGYDDQEDWSEKEFNDDIAREREGRRPLLAGDLTVTLKEGVGCIGEVIFTDNSSWTRTRKFRLGARVVSKFSGEVEIREARSNQFMVKDHRGELYKKHYPPYPNDEIWRLNKISKDGVFHNRLVFHEICTVKDILRQYMRDSSALRRMFGVIPDKAWRSIIEHASACVLDESEQYCYHIGQDIYIFFNSIYKVVGASFSDQYYPVDKLNPDQKNVVEKWKLHAYRNIGDFIPVNELCTGHIARPLGSLQTQPSYNPSLDVQSIDLQVVHQDQSATQLDINPAYPFESHQLVCSSAQNNYQIPEIRNNFLMPGFLPTHSNGGPSWCSSQEPFMPNISVSSENLFQVQTSTFFPSTVTWDQGNNLLFASNCEEETEFFPSSSNSVNRKPKVRWCKIRAAVTLVTAARRWRDLLYFSY